MLDALSVQPGSAAAALRRPCPAPLPPPPPQVLSEDSSSTVRWLRLDCSPLKEQLVGLCDTWVAALSGLLASMAAKGLGELEQELRQAVAQLGAGAEGEDEAGESGEAGAGGGQPATAEELEALHGRLEGEREEWRQRVDACLERYEALAGLQAGVAEGELERVEALQALQARVLGALDGVPARLRAMQGAAD